MKPRWAIGWRAFALFLNSYRAHVRGLSMDAAAEEARVGKAIVCRAENAIAVSAANFLALCHWMAVDPRIFLIDPDTEKTVWAQGVPADAPRETPDWQGTTPGPAILKALGLGEAEAAEARG